MADLQQRSFIGGMNLLSVDTEIGDTEYGFAFNVRQRYQWLESIQKSTNITYNLSGKFQGLYAVGAIWLTFFSGKAYYMAVGGIHWTRVPNLQLDPFVDYIYAQAVTGSTNNFLRKAVVTSDFVDSTAGVIKTNAFAVSGTPAGVVCQDGINQPWLITYDSVNNNATARRLGTYDEWDNTGTTANSREYVPIGTKMMFLDSVLYIVAPIGNIVYRSVSGRPLDFMINIDQNGDKLATESLGGAASVSFAQDFDNINALIPIGTGQFLISTSRFIYGEQADFTKPSIFGEPQFTKIFQLEAGIVNQFCLSDKNGDTAFIDFEGVKFFNTVQQLKFEGSNDPLSKNINKSLEGISQNICCSIAFNNYNLFALKTLYGYAIAVFDNLISKWVGFDITEATVSGIKMFAETVIPNARYLAAGNQNNEIWLMYSDTVNRETGTVQLKAFVFGGYSNLGNFVPDGLFTEHKTNHFKVGIYNGKISGTITAVELVNDKRSQVGTRDIDAVIEGFAYPVMPPVIGNNQQAVNNVNFPFNKGLSGYKITPIITWDSDCKIVCAQLSTSSNTKPVSQNQQSRLIATP